MNRRTTEVPLPWLVTLALATGAASLAYEILWARLLAIQTGDPLGAFVIVVTSYMAGLATGAVLAGRVAPRTRRPLFLLALAQAGIAGAGALSALLATTGGPVRWLLRGLQLQPGEATFELLRAVVSGIGCFVPAALMGATLPLLMEASSMRRPAGKTCGLLAGASALGASAGALLCGFLLLPHLGMRRSLLATVAVGALTALVALVVSRRATPSAARQRAPEPSADRAIPTPGSFAPLAVILTGGLSVTVLEVSWTRVAQLCFGSSVAAASLVLAAVIAGLAAGNLWGGNLADSPRRFRRLALLLAAAPASILLTDPLLGRLPLLTIAIDSWGAAGTTLSGGSPAARMVELGVMFLTTLLPCLLAGALLPVGYACLLSDLPGASPSRLVGYASAVASAGHLVGAPLALALLMDRGGSRAGLVFSVAALCLAALPLARRLRSRWLATVSVGLAAAAFLLPAWDPALLSSGPYLYAPLYRAAAREGAAGLSETIHQRGEVVFARDGRHALVTVRRLTDGALSMQVNGKTDASTGGDMKTQTLTAQLPLLLHAGTGQDGAGARVLVIGLGSGVTVASALTHPVASVEVIELLPEVVEAAGLFADANRGALDDFRTDLVVADARSRLIFSPGRYDVIASQPSNPWIEGEAILFTREFFELAREHLAPGGIMCQWVQGYGLDPEDFVSVIATFAQVFPYVTLWEESTAGGDYLLLGSERPVEVDPGAVERRMSRPVVQADLARVEISSVADLLSHFVTEGALLRRLTESAEIQSEDRLALEFRALPSLHRDTLGGILARLAPARLTPAILAGDDAPLAARLDGLHRAAREDRRWIEGLGLFRPVEPAHPDLLRAISYLGAGMTRHARALVEELTRVRPADPLPRLLLAHLAMSAGDAGQASRELALAVALAPEEPSSRLYLSRALFATGRPMEALVQNLEASRLSLSEGQRAEGASDRCALLLSLDDPASAEAACLDALAGEPDLAEAHANLGLVRARRGRVEEARRSYERALELAPGLEDARFNLARLHERAGRGKEGLEILAPMLDEHVPPGVEVLDLAARLSLLAGEQDEARRFVERSLLLDPDNEESRRLKDMVESGGI